MKFQIFRTTTIKDLKQQFADNFPYLKIEFFWKEHEKGKGSFMEDCIPEDYLLTNVNPDLAAVAFFFQPDFTVAHFEQSVQNELGLPVQVFRKSGNIWLETINTDHLSLQKQNMMGQASVKAERINIYSLFL
jgi:hypothetical protein